MDNKLRTEVITITPALAKAWLEKNLPTNRRLSNHSVDRLVHEMEKGYWKITGDSIKFNTSGHLIDGQHRLRACIKANITIQSMVVWGVRDDAFDAIDRNQVRSNAQILSIRGEKNANSLASALRYLYCYRCGDLTRGSLAVSIIGPQDLEELLQKEGGLRESIRAAMPLKSLLSIGPGGFLHYILAEKDMTSADIFINQLATGEMLRKTEVVYKLREKLIKSNLIKQQKDDRNVTLEKLGMCVTVWNLLREGSKKTTFDYDTADPFPEAI